MARCCGENISDRVTNQVSGQRTRVGSRYEHHTYLAEKRRALELWEQRLQIARRELTLESAIAKLDRYDLLILDDLAYVTKDQAENRQTGR